MKFLVKYHPEIMIKSRPVRKRCCRLLKDNLKRVLEFHQMPATVIQEWDRIVLLPKTDDAAVIAQIGELLQCVPGINQYQLVEMRPFVDFDDIWAQLKPLWQHKVAGKTFAVRAKRRGKHDFRSIDLERYIGGAVLQHTESAGVDLKSPQVEINFEVDQDQLLIIHHNVRCLGGMPLPLQGDVLSLISGGYDSSVSSFQMQRRGTRNHFIFFNLGGRQHEIAVRELCHFLWQKYSLSHRVKFVAVDFAEVIAQIEERVDLGYRGIILKRSMLKAAEIVAQSMKIPALITGDSMGQVSSQTLANLNVIDQGISTTVLRPLICTDKEQIIDQARAIGTEDYAKVIPEYCGAVSKQPNVEAVLAKALEEESKLDTNLLADLVRAARVEDINKVLQSNVLPEIETVSQYPTEANAVVLDIRSAEEEEQQPLELDDLEVQWLPFFRVASGFPKLPQDKTYYLYCGQGVMSRLQVGLLVEQGYQNAKVLLL